MICFQEKSGSMLDAWGIGEATALESAANMCRKSNVADNSSQTCCRTSVSPDETPAAAESSAWPPEECWRQLLSALRQIQAIEAQREVRRVGVGETERAA